MGDQHVEDISGAPTMLGDDATTLAGARTVLPDLPGGVPAASGVARLRFEQKRVLGKGGMGEVVLAEDRDIGRMVAIKHLLSREGVARFAEEVRTIGRLEHPNIPPVHDVGMDERGHFFVMKYVEGETLASIIEKLRAGDAEYQRTYSFERRTEIFSGILRALQFAHSKGIIHRDIKPANVMVGAHGEVMLMDWGVARAPRSAQAPAGAGAAPESFADATLPPGATTDGSLIGTPHYMSPEQARGENAAVDERSDVYSASVLFHELLCLRHYLTDLQSLPLLLEWLCGPEELPVSELATRRAPSAPLPAAELLYVVAQGLRKDPAQRHQSVGAMLEQLQAATEGRFKVRCTFTMAKRITRDFGRLVDRHPHKATYLLATLLGLSAFGLVQLVLQLLLLLV